MNGTTGLNENQSKCPMSRRGIVGTTAGSLKCGKVKVKRSSLIRALINHHHHKGHKAGLGST